MRTFEIFAIWVDLDRFQRYYSFMPDANALSEPFPRSPYYDTKLWQVF